jgi:hypothetical protein
MGVGSLILLPLDDFPIAFLASLRGVGLLVAFHLLAPVFDTLALAPADGLLADLPLGDRN